MRVLVPRATEADDTLLTELLTRGLEPVVVPTLRLVLHPEAVTRSLAEAPERDLLLTSPAAARALSAAGGPASRTVWALGPGSASGCPSAVTGDGDPGAWASSLPTDRRYLWVRAAEPAPEMPGRLAALDVIHVTAYHNEAPPDLDVALRAAWPIDLMITTAPSVARRLAGPWPPEGQPHPPVAAIGPSTARAAAAAGLLVVAIGVPPGITGLMAAIDRWRVRAARRP